MNVLLLGIISVDHVFASDTDMADLSAVGLIIVQIVAILECAVTSICSCFYICTSHSWCDDRLVVLHASFMVRRR